MRMSPTFNSNQNICTPESWEKAFPEHHRFFNVLLASKLPRLHTSSKHEVFHSTCFNLAVAKIGHPAMYGHWFDIIQECFCSCEYCWSLHIIMTTMPRWPSLPSDNKLCNKFLSACFLTMTFTGLLVIHFWRVEWREFLCLWHIEYFSCTWELSCCSLGFFVDSGLSRARSMQAMLESVQLIS